MCAVVVSKTSCKDKNHRILRGVIAPHQDFFFCKNHDFSRFLIKFSTVVVVKHTHVVDPVVIHGEYMEKKINVLKGFCLRVGLFTPRWGMGGGWGSWPPDWVGWAGSPGPLRGDTSGCVWCGKRLVVVSRMMTGGL
jgi:hypothetical protein